MPFITQPQAKKKSRRSAQKSRPRQNLLVHPRTPPHRQVDPVLPAPATTLGRAAELIDAKPPARDLVLGGRLRLHLSWRTSARNLVCRFPLPHRRRLSRRISISA